MSNLPHEKIDTDPIDNILNEGLESSLNAIHNTFHENPDPECIIEDQPSTEDFVQSVNERVLLERLAPEISKNEKLKRKHKNKLIAYLAHFLCAQFFIMFVFIMMVLISIIVFHAMGNDFSEQTEKMIFAFFGTYITSVIVELIYILTYIVKNVFDTSISGLMHDFKTSKTNE